MKLLSYVCLSSCFFFLIISLCSRSLCLLFSASSFSSGASFFNSNISFFKASPSFSSSYIGLSYFLVPMTSGGNGPNVDFFTGSYFLGDYFACSFLAYSYFAEILLCLIASSSSCSSWILAFSSIALEVAIAFSISKRSSSLVSISTSFAIPGSIY